MTTDQVEFTVDELLADHDGLTPLIAEGVRCHGGFDEAGDYVSPRTRFRAPAIVAWEEQRAERSGTEAVGIPLDSWPESFPSIEQSKFLLRAGVPGPTISALTRIGTVEGFGAMLRMLPQPDLQPFFADDIRGSATDHIRKGLFEAHARDEAGWEAEAGHDRMWFAARDIAFDHPVTEDETQRMLDRMGIPTPGKAPSAGSPDFAAIFEQLKANRALPADIDFMLEMMLTRMIGLLFIEIQAFHTFTWAEGVLSDTDLCAGDGEAARLIRYVRADETPHVAYLQVALSEMRDWTWVGEQGRTHDGAAMIEKLWDRALQESRFLKRPELLKLTFDEIHRALEGRSDGDDVFDEFLSIGTVRPLADGSFIERTRGGAEVRVA